MIDIERLEELPFKESRAQYLTRTVGSMYDIPKFDDKDIFFSNKNDDPWVISTRVINKFLGQHFNIAFKYYCKKVKKYQQETFFKQFEGKYPNYKLDSEENIILGYTYHKERRTTFYSFDYETALKDKNGRVTYRSDKYYWYFLTDKRYIEFIYKGFTKEFEDHRDKEFIKLKRQDKINKRKYLKQQKKDKINKADFTLKYKKKNKNDSKREDKSFNKYIKFLKKECIKVDLLFMNGKLYNSNYDSKIIPCNIIIANN